MNLFNRILSFVKKVFLPKKNCCKWKSC